jgi:hypothetical protein
VKIAFSKCSTDKWPGYGCQTALQNCLEIDEITALVMLSVGPASVLVLTDDHVARLVEDWMT